jgi:hypothetical protein
MAYIGKTPVIGNFQVCDAITVVDAQAAYTMQVSSVDVFPETANHMLVSLNGILQAPTTSYTVSGSTITFASALETGDVIDFIQILGNVLDLGVPSDNTVSLAKLTATGTKDATTFLRGDNTFAEVPAGGLTLIKTQTVSSNVSSVDFVNGTGGCVIDSTYEYYIVRFSGVRFNSQGGLAGRLGTSGGFISASDYHQNEAMLLSNGSAWSLNQEETKNSFRVTDRRYTNTTAGFSVNGEVRFYNMSSTSLYKAYWMEAVGFGNNASEVSYIVGSGMLEDSTSKDAANDRIQFLPLTASSIASGSFTLYGVKK